jgi:hypothetical protein
LNRDQLLEMNQTKVQDGEDGQQDQTAEPTEVPPKETDLFPPDTFIDLHCFWSLAIKTAIQCRSLIPARKKCIPTIQLNSM